MQIFNTNQEKGDMPLLISGKTDFKAGSITRDKRIKVCFNSPEDITNASLFAPNVVASNTWS